MFKSTDNGNSWTLAGGTVDETANTVSLTGINDFSTWTLGDVNSPLPVELTSLTATAQNEIVTLNWQTATEKNNSGWDIERIAPDSKTWNKIGFVKGSSNSSELQKYSFQNKINQSGKYQYRIKQLDFDGTFEYSKTVEVEILTPAKFSLQNYPNPFNPSTVINFEIPKAAKVNLVVYNMLGQKITTLVNQFLEAGAYQQTFNAEAFSSGIYIYQLSAGNVVLTKKMMLTK